MHETIAEGDPAVGSDLVMGMSSVAALDARLPFRAFVLDNWSVEQGLPQITALSITQDRAGYLWIGMHGHLLAAARRAGDVTVRWGGEEFLLLLNDVDANSAMASAERLRRNIAAEEFSDSRGGNIRLTCSIGFSLHPLAAESGNDTFEAALELADIALYRAKREGRNACVGLIANTLLTASALQQPLIPQINSLLASGTLRWLRN